MYTKGQQVEDVITGAEGVVNADEGGATVNVSWDPNEHGGYINDHPRELVHPVER